MLVLEPFFFLDEVDLKSSDDLFGALVLVSTVEKFVCFRLFWERFFLKSFWRSTLNLKLKVSFFLEDRLDTNRKVVR